MSKGGGAESMKRGGPKEGREKSTGQRGEGN